MTYLLGALVVLLLASGLGLSIWVSKLKDQVQHWLVLHAQAVSRFTQERNRAVQYLTERRRLEDERARARRTEGGGRRRRSLVGEVGDAGEATLLDAPDLGQGPAAPVSHSIDEADHSRRELRLVVEGEPGRDAHLAGDVGDEVEAEEEADPLLLLGGQGLVHRDVDRPVLDA